MVKLDKWESNVDKIKAAINQEHKIKIILESFLTDFSLNEAMLFRYSPIDHLAEGILSATKSEFKHISSIRDDITSIPAIFKAIKTRTPQYYEGNNFHLNISKNILSQITKMLYWLFLSYLTKLSLAIFWDPNLRSPLTLNY